MTITLDLSIIVKICGITNGDDALDAVDCGADWLGFNFYRDSPRFIEPSVAKTIFQEIPPAVSKVGIFVNADRDWVLDLAIELGLDFLQFHGDEGPAYCNAVGRPWYKAFRLRDEKDIEPISRYESDWILVDSYVEKVFGGSGVVSNWDLAREAKKYGKLILSGGLRPDNVDLALRSVKSAAVDVASGVESSPGVKDRFKMEEFIRRVKSFEN